MPEKTNNENVRYLHDEIMNTIERCRAECDNLTIAEALGVLENVKLAMWYTSMIKLEE